MQSETNISTLNRVLLPSTQWYILSTIITNIRTVASLLSDVKETLLEKEKLLMMSNFSCARNYIFLSDIRNGGKKHCGGKWKKSLKFQINKFKILLKHNINYKYIYWNVSIICYKCIKLKEKLIKPEMKLSKLLPFVLLPVWKYFRRSEKIASCTLCEAELSYHNQPPQSSTTQTSI